MTSKPKGYLLEIMHLVFYGALRDALNSMSKHPNKLDSKCRLALFRQIKTSRESCLVQGQCSLTREHFPEEGKLLWERGVFRAKKVLWITRGGDAKFFSTEEQELRRACHLLKERSRAHTHSCFPFLEKHQKGQASQNRGWGGSS